MIALLTRVMQLVGLRVFSAITDGIIRGISAALAALPLITETKRYLYWVLEKFIFGV